MKTKPWNQKISVELYYGFVWRDQDGVLKSKVASFTLKRFGTFSRFLRLGCQINLLIRDEGVLVGLVPKSQWPVWISSYFLERREAYRRRNKNASLYQFGFGNDMVRQRDGRQQYTMLLFMYDFQNQTFATGSVTCYKMHTGGILDINDKHISMFNMTLIWGGGSWSDPTRIWTWSQWSFPWEGWKCTDARHLTWLNFSQQG